MHKKAIKELNRENEFDIEHSIDKDTNEEGGTPHIADTIFSKIAKAAFFVADISIVNPDYSGRKTPNPNVLLELGYAARVLGWNRIICIFNEDFGPYNDLPFDLRFRRPLTYSLNGKDKLSVRKDVVSKLKDNIKWSSDQNMPANVEVGQYIVLEVNALDIYFQDKIHEILKSQYFQENYPYINNNYIIDIWDDMDYRYENNEPCEDTDIEHFVSVVFTDDCYSYGECTNRECSIFITLRECFKQINFSVNKVYAAYEITSSGYSPSGIGRNYAELSADFLARLQ